MESERYEGYLTTVRAIADELLGHPTAESLVAAYEERSELLDSVARRLGQGADPEVVVDAAFNLRYREVFEQSRRSDTRRRIAEATADWVLIRQSTITRDLPGYERLELHVRSGAGLHAWIEEDVDSGRPRYGVQVLRLHPGTGEPMPEAPLIEPPVTFGEPAPWERARADLRRRLGDPGRKDT